MTNVHMYVLSILNKLTVKSGYFNNRLEINIYLHIA